MVRYGQYLRARPGSGWRFDQYLWGRPGSSWRFDQYLSSAMLRRSRGIASSERNPRAMKLRLSRRGCKFRSTLPAALSAGKSTKHAMELATSI